MILVVGGQGAGKKEYVRSLGYAETDCTVSLSDEHPVLLELHVILRKTPQDAENILPALLRKDVVVCNEVGCGIVPMDAGERAWRDRVGRICALLAAKADRVVRVCCGIPVCIKGGDVKDICLRTPGHKGIA